MERLPWNCHGGAFDAVAMVRNWGAKLLDRAKHPKINLAPTLEERLTRVVREAEADERLAANRKAIDADNARAGRLWRHGGAFDPVADKRLRDKS